MTLLCRVQRRRIKGWRMPPNTTYVGRGSKYGNPYRIGARDERTGGVLTAGTATQRYAEDLNLGKMHWIGARRWLRGRNLACWCVLCEAHKVGKPLGVYCGDCEPCHADVLFCWANE